MPVATVIPVLRPFVTQSSLNAKAASKTNVRALAEGEIKVIADKDEVV
jgi:hypothetical protein